MTEHDDRGPSQLLTDFWPHEDHHGVDHVLLEVEPPSRAAEVMSLLQRIAALSDSMRGLQTSDGVSVSDEATAMLGAETAEALFELAELVDDDSAVVIRQRAEVLAGRADAAETSRKIANDGTAPPLEIVCGSLCTWRAKTRSPLHSFVAARHNQRVQEQLDACDEAMDEVRAELRDVLDTPKLYSKCSMAMHATDMIASAGEAAGHPKHFAYFLPQDEGIEKFPLDRQRTLYLHNVHRVRFERITAPLADGLLEGPMSAGEVPIDSTLAPWIRGHDHGHNLAVEGTEVVHDGLLKTLTQEPFSMLGEAFANVYGFLMLISEPWLRIAGVTRLDMCTTHIAELLHYMRRGPQHYSDPGAAYLELSFLAAEGFVEVDGQGRIRWNEEDLCKGMTELAKLLTQAVVGPSNEQDSIVLLDRYAWPEQTPAGEVPDTPAGRTRDALRRDLANVPTSIVFYNTSDVATGGRLSLAA